MVFEDLWYILFTTSTFFFFFIISISCWSLSFYSLLHIISQWTIIFVTTSDLLFISRTDFLPILTIINHSLSFLLSKAQSIEGISAFFNDDCITKLLFCLYSSMLPLSSQQMEDLLNNHEEAYWEFVWFCLCFSIDEFFLSLDCHLTLWNDSQTISWTDCEFHSTAIFTPSIWINYTKSTLLFLMYDWKRWWLYCSLFELSTAVCRLDLSNLIKT